MHGSGREGRQHRPRSRDRDQRMPTFHVIDHPHHNSHNPQKKHEEHVFHPPTPKVHPKPPIQTSQSHENTHSRNTNKLALSKQRVRATNRPPVTDQPSKCRVTSSIGSDLNETRNSSTSSRGPACSFAGLFQHTRKRSNSVSPKRAQVSQSKSKIERNEDEPSDVVVWNASKKISRANILCPLTESEYQVYDHSQKGRQAKRSRSLPSSGKLFGMSTNDKFYSLDDAGQADMELLDDFRAPTTPHGTSSSVSIASSFNVTLATVSQQLEQIEQEQHNILKQLGDEIAGVAIENSRLLDEIKTLRKQKQELIINNKMICTDLDNISQICRIYKVPIPRTSSGSISIPVPKRDEKHEKEDIYCNNNESPPELNIDREKRHGQHSNSKSRSRSREQAKSSSPTPTGTKTSPGRPHLTDKSSHTSHKKDKKPPKSPPKPTPEEVFNAKKAKAKVKKHESHGDSNEDYFLKEVDSTASQHDQDDFDNTDILCKASMVLITDDDGSFTQHDPNRNQNRPNDKSRRKSSAEPVKNKRSPHTSADRKNSTHKIKNDKNKSLSTASNDKTHKRRGGGGGCFKCFNVFWPQRAYESDEDELSQIP